MFLLQLLTLILAVKAYSPVVFDFKKTYTRGNARKSIFARDELSAALTNHDVIYTIEVDIGTPAQRVSLHLDSGSSVMWVIAATNPFCKNALPNNQNPPPGINPQPVVDCAKYGTFNPGSSSSYQNLGSDFEMNYVDNSFARGPWSTDKMTIGDKDISGLVFMVADYAKAVGGILGIGRAGSSDHSDANLPSLLVKKGVISRNVYSLFLNSRDSSTGQIIFGGVDTAKFRGTLQTLPTVDVDSAINIKLQGMGFVDGNGNSHDLNIGSIKAQFDSGSYEIAIPKDMLTQMAQKLGATFKTNGGYYTMPCEGNKEVTFDFGEITIRAPMSAFLKPQSQPGVCALLMIPYTGSSIILGDVFLASAYVVYDLDKEQVSIAQASYNDDSNVQIVTGDIPRDSTGPSPKNQDSASTILETSNQETLPSSSSTSTFQALGVTEITSFQDTTTPTQQTSITSMSTSPPTTMFLSYTSPASYSHSVTVSSSSIYDTVPPSLVSTNNPRTVSIMMSTSKTLTPSTSSSLILTKSMLINSNSGTSVFNSTTTSSTSNSSTTTSTSSNSSTSLTFLSTSTSPTSTFSTSSSSETSTSSNTKKHNGSNREQPYTKGFVIIVGIISYIL